MCHSNDGIRCYIFVSCLETQSIRQSFQRGHKAAHQWAEKSQLVSATVPPSNLLPLFIYSIFHNDDRKTVLGDDWGMMCLIAISKNLSLVIQITPLYCMKKFS